MGKASEDFIAWCESRGCHLAAVELRDAPPPLAISGVGAADVKARGRGVFAKVFNPP